MRYPPTHKHATRRRIVDAAAQAFRERGVAETGVDEVMRRAGLTHGGFYSHFRDKSELVAEACASVFDGAIPNLDRIAAGRTPAVRARLLIDSYLASRHRDNPGSGCVVVAVGADMARLQGAARAGYAAGFAQHMDRLCAALRLHRDAEVNRTRVLHLMSSLVGALLFARAATGPQESDWMLQRMRRHLRDEFCAGTNDNSTSRAARVPSAEPEF